MDLTEGLFLSSLFENSGGGGGGSALLKVGALRPDAILDSSWTYDKYAVEDEGITLPAYTTSSVTLKDSATVGTAVLDDNYDYCVTVRGLVIPDYSVDTKAYGREVYAFNCSVYDYVCIPYPSPYGASGTSFYIISSGSGVNQVVLYYSNSTEIKCETSNYGANITLTAPSFSTSTNTLTLSSPKLTIRGGKPYLNQTYFDAITDIRFQYIVELWKSPKGNMNIDGYMRSSQMKHIIDCYNNGGTLT